jgi:hypothetical protein
MASKFGGIKSNSDGRIRMEEMSRHEYQEHFISSYGPLPTERKADRWDESMKYRKENGLTVWPNPWRYDDGTKISVPV